MKDLYPSNICIVSLFLLAVIYIYWYFMPCYAILSRVIFKDILIDSILICIRYCIIIVHFGLWTLQSLMISLRLACFVWLWLMLYCNFGYLFAVCGIVTALTFDGARDIRRDRTWTFFLYERSVTVVRIVLRSPGILTWWMGQSTMGSLDVGSQLSQVYSHMSCITWGATCRFILEHGSLLWPFSMTSLHTRLAAVGPALCPY